LATAVRSVLASRHPSFRLLVIDQSTDEASRCAVEEFLGDSRLRYVRSNAVGVSRARNQALRQADTDVVVFTDDDCEVHEGWLAAMHGLFAEHPRVAQAFCSVRPGPHDAVREFVPAYECSGTRIVRTLLDKCTARGMGAGMAVRTQAVLDAGGFDEELGPGATFPSNEEGDLAVRLLMRGHEICETDRTHVIHHGSRTFSEGRTLSRRDWVGIGAAYSKPLRVGALGIVPIALYELAFKAVGPALVDMAHLRRPRGLARGAHFLNGFARGLLAPLDGERLVFKTPT
jgi:glycosyltransferase involved in cell wall biosynthesis